GHPHGPGFAALAHHAPHSHLRPQARGHRLPSRPRRGGGRFEHSPVVSFSRESVRPLGHDPGGNHCICLGADSLRYARAPCRLRGSHPGVARRMIPPSSRGQSRIDEQLPSALANARLTNLSLECWTEAFTETTKTPSPR